MRNFNDLIQAGTLAQVVEAINAGNTEYEAHEMAAMYADGEELDLDVLVESGANFDYVKALELL